MASTSVASEVVKYHVLVTCFSFLVFYSKMVLDGKQLKIKVCHDLHVNYQSYTLLIVLWF